MPQELLAAGSLVQVFIKAPYKEVLGILGDTKPLGGISPLKLNILLVDGLLHREVLIRCLEWSLAREEGVSYDAGAPDVDFEAVVFLIDHFWRHVLHVCIQSSLQLPIT